MPLFSGRPEAEREPTRLWVEGDTQLISAPERRTTIFIRPPRTPAIPPATGGEGTGSGEWLIALEDHRRGAQNLEGLTRERLAIAVKDTGPPRSLKELIDQFCSTGCGDQESPARTALDSASIYPEGLKPPKLLESTRGSL